MKTNILILASVLAGGFAVTTTALANEGYERVEISQLPPRVRHAVEANARGETIREVRTRTIDGRMVYEIDTGHGGRVLRFSADGELVPEGAPVAVVAPPVRHEERVYTATTTTEPVATVRVDELPGHTREFIEREYHGRHIERIRREQYEGRTVFGLSFGDGGAEVWVGEDGAVIHRR